MAHTISITSPIILFTIQKKKDKIRSYFRRSLKFSKTPHKFKSKRRQSNNQMFWIKNVTVASKELIRRIGHSRWVSMVCRHQCIPCLWWCHQWVSQLQCQVIKKLVQTLINVTVWNVVSRNLKKISRTTLTKTNSCTSNGCNNACINKCMNHTNYSKN